jgi:uncharacterized membrane protein
MPLPDSKNTTPVYVLWALLVLYAGGRLLELRSGGVPTLTIVALQVLAAGLFALVHGALTYRPRGILAFVGLSVVVGAFFESLSLRTGFPFGHYYFTGVMGPQLFHLPILLVLAYIGMGYASWVLGFAILGNMGRPVCGRQVFTLPLICSFIMVAWDLALDPVWANVAVAWVWKDGGPFFGVPVSNFLGWFLTVYVIYQLFALYLRNRVMPPQAPGHWRLPIFFYAVTAASNLLFALPAFSAYRLPPVVTDASGHLWRVSDILSVCVLVSLFVMLPFALIAWGRLSDQKH